MSQRCSSSISCPLGQVCNNRICEPIADAAQSTVQKIPIWGWVLIGLFVLIILITIICLCRRKGGCFGSKRPNKYMDNSPASAPGYYPGSPVRPQQPYPPAQTQYGRQSAIPGYTGSAIYVADNGHGPAPLPAHYTKPVELMEVAEANKRRQEAEDRIILQQEQELARIKQEKERQEREKLQHEQMLHLQQQQQQQQQMYAQQSGMEYGCSSGSPYYGHSGVYPSNQSHLQPASGLTPPSNGFYTPNPNTYAGGYPSSSVSNNGSAPQGHIVEQSAPAFPPRNTPDVTATSPVLLLATEPPVRHPDLEVSALHRSSVPSTFLPDPTEPLKSPMNVGLMSVPASPTTSEEEQDSSVVAVDDQKHAVSAVSAPVAVKEEAPMVVQQDPVPTMDMSPPPIPEKDHDDSVVDKRVSMYSLNESNPPHMSPFAASSPHPDRIKPAGGRAMPSEFRFSPSPSSDLS